MEAVILIGIQGSGKSSFFKEHLFQTHVRISLDLLRTRHREKRILEACLATQMRFAIDNTNPSRAERLPYIESAKRAHYSVIGYYFESRVGDCLGRNAARPEAQRVPDVGILSAARRLERPSHEEGFDQLFHVRLHDGQFLIEEWRDEV